MQVKETTLKDCYILEPAVYRDGRGYFFESFNRQVFEKLTGHSGLFVQDNQSCSEYGVIRGLHYQTGDHTQAKLVRVLSGKVLDVAVDLRSASPTFGQCFSIELSAENNLQLYVPRGFAHGFSVLSEQAAFAYKCDNYYNKASEAGIRYDDPVLAIDWRVPAGSANISEKDALLGSFEDACFFE